MEDMMTPPPPPAEEGTERTYGNMLNEKTNIKMPKKKKKFTSIGQLKDLAKAMKEASDEKIRKA